MNKPEVHIPNPLKPSSDKTIFIAISGGVDSIVLLDLLSKEDTQIHLLHVNYHLRGEDSNADEQLIRKLASKYSVEVSVLDFNMQKHLAKNGGNLQNEARKIRYNFFQKHVGENGVLMTAHHLDDQMETFFMHLSRKSGIAGMSCMAEQNGNHWRPLLGFRKSELYDYAKKNDLEFREDQSNTENKYLRNRWRNDWIPQMEKENSQLAQEIQVLIAGFQNERKVLEEKYNPIIESIQETGKWSFESFDASCNEGKYLITKQLGLRASELEQLKTLRDAGRSKKLDVKREDLTVWNGGNSFIFSRSVNFKTPELNIASIDEMPESFDKSCIYLDEDKIKGELSIRTWQEGDRIAPIGMNGTQLVSDIIKDAKVASSDRSEVLVVHDDQEIVWVVGLKVGRMKIGKQDSKNLLSVKVIV